MAGWTKKYKWLIGKNMPFSAWGVTGQSRGMYVSGEYINRHYGIKGLFGLNIYESWGIYKR